MIAVDCSEAATLIQVLPISPTLEEAVQMMNEQDWDNYMINLIKPKQNNNDKKKSYTETSNETEVTKDEWTIMSGLTLAQMEGSCYFCS